MSLLTSNLSSLSGGYSNLANRRGPSTCHPTGPTCAPSCVC